MFAWINFYVVRISSTLRNLPFAANYSFYQNVSSSLNPSFRRHFRTIFRSRLCGCVKFLCLKLSTFSSSADSHCHVFHKSESLAGLVGVTAHWPRGHKMPRYFWLIEPSSSNSIMEVDPSTSISMRKSRESKRNQNSMSMQISCKTTVFLMLSVFTIMVSFLHSFLGHNLFSSC